MTFIPEPRELEKKTDYFHRFLHHKDVRENFNGHKTKMDEANRLWTKAWKNAAVTVVSNKGGDFFIKD